MNYPTDIAPLEQAGLSDEQIAAVLSSVTVQPVPLIGSGAPAGMAFDSESQRLSIVYRGGWKQHPTATESYPVVAEFEVE